MFTTRSFWLILAFVIISSSLCYADVPHKISFQGILDPVPETNPSDVTFNIYDASDATEALWSETQSVAFDEKGVFNVDLGETTELDLDFDTQYWIGIEISDSDELSPRIPLVSVPYAYYSEMSGKTRNLNTPVTIEYDEDQPTLKSINTYSDGYGIHGIAYYGIYGQASKEDGAGVYGTHSATNNYGMLGTSMHGVHGQTLEFYGVYGQYDDTNWGALGANSFGVKGYHDETTNYGELGTSGAGIIASGNEGYGIDIYAGWNSDGGVQSRHFRSGNVTVLTSPTYSVYGYTEDMTAVMGEYDLNDTHQSKGSLASSEAGVWGWTNDHQKQAARFQHNHGTDVKLASVDHAIWGKSWNKENIGYLASSSFGVYGEYAPNGNFGYIGSENWGAYMKHAGTNNHVFIAGNDKALVANNPNFANYANLGSESGAVSGYESTVSEGVSINSSGFLASQGYGVVGVGDIGGVYGIADDSNAPGVLGEGNPAIGGLSSNGKVIAKIANNTSVLEGTYYNSVTLDPISSIKLGGSESVLWGEHNSFGHSVYLCTSDHALLASDGGNYFVYIPYDDNAIMISGDAIIQGDLSVSDEVDCDELTCSVFNTTAEALTITNNVEIEGGCETTGSMVIGGNCQITGNLSKGSGSFKIDHPLDPKNKFLYHSFVESPEMMNIYRGNAILNENGEAKVSLPEYFEALNMEFSYQLTPIGKPAPNLYIAKEIRDNTFFIAGGNPGQKICWQVTGVRNDPYAQNNRIEVEVEKADYQKGKYLHPEAYGENREKKIMGR